VVAKMNNQDVVKVFVSFECSPESSPLAVNREHLTMLNNCI